MASWSLKGQFPSEARNSFFGMALAVYIAAETFGAHEHRYKVLMSALVLISAAFIGYKALKAKSLLGLATVATALIWIAPIVNENVFYSVDLFFMVAHSALALLVAVGSFTYLKN